MRPGGYMLRQEDKAMRKALGLILLVAIATRRSDERLPPPTRECAASAPRFIARRRRHILTTAISPTM